jgi:hypothetical protein
LAIFVTSLNACRKQIHTHNAVTPGGALFRRPDKAIEAMGDRHVPESGDAEDVDELCFQQSARDSTGPEVNIA